MSHAWHIAALPRQKKFPELHTLLRGKPHRPPRQSWEAQEKILASF